MRGPPYRAVVQELSKGHHGAYAVATCELGYVTFSLKKGVWKERGSVKCGSVVIIDDVRLTTKGWRAYSARFVRPKDEPQTETAVSNEEHDNASTGSGQNSRPDSERHHG